MNGPTGTPEPLKRLIEEFGRLPGIGTRTAERLAWYVVKAAPEDALGLADAIREAKRRLMPCRECLNFAQGELCGVCLDPERDRSLVMVVSHPKDVAAFERTGRFRGVYHVLMGHLSPHEGTDVQHLAVDRLLERIAAGGIREVVLATNPDAEGDGTALALAALLEPRGPRVTRLARGLPTGYSIEYAGTEILSEALEGRRGLPSADDRKER